MLASSPVAGCQDQCLEFIEAIAERGVIISTTVEIFSIPTIPSELDGDDILSSLSQTTSVLDLTKMGTFNELSQSQRHVIENSRSEINLEACLNYTSKKKLKNMIDNSKNRELERFRCRTLSQPQTPTATEDFEQMDILTRTSSFFGLDISTHTRSLPPVDSSGSNTDDVTQAVTKEEEESSNIIYKSATMLSSFFNPESFIDSLSNSAHMSEKSSIRGNETNEMDRSIHVIQEEYSEEYGENDEGEGGGVVMLESIHESSSESEMLSSDEIQVC